MSTEEMLQKELFQLGVGTTDAEKVSFLTSADEVESTKFRGTDLDVLFGLIYILQRYNGGCSPIHPTIDSKNTLFMNLGINWICRDGGRIMTFPKEFFKNFDACKKRKDTRFIFAFLTLINSKNCSRNLDDAHANLIVYDKKKNLFERFEPNGCSIEFSDWFEVHEFDHAFTKVAHGLYNAEYHPSLICCPLVGIQATQESEKMRKRYDPGGFCAAFSLWVMGLRLKNPNENFRKLQLAAIKKVKNKEKNFTTFIRNFSAFVVKKRKEVFNTLPKDMIKKIEKNPDTIDELDDEHIQKVNHIILREFKKIK
jgi:hypothetical protein